MKSLMVFAFPLICLCGFKLTSNINTPNPKIDYATLIHALSSDEFNVVNDNEQIPKSLLNALGPGVKRSDFANPTEPFQATDVSMGRSIPKRQITMLAKSDSFLVLAYKRGGRGLSQHLLWCRVRGKDISDLNLVDTVTEFKSIKQLREYLNAEQDLESMMPESHQF